MDLATEPLYLLPQISILKTLDACRHRGFCFYVVYSFISFSANLDIISFQPLGEKFIKVPYFDFQYR